MRRIAWFYIHSVLITAVILASIAFFTRPQDPPSLWLILSLTTAATLMRMFVIEAPNNHSYEGSTIIFMASVWLLPFWYFIVVVTVAHYIEWMWVRWRKPSMLGAWYLQPFNIAKCIIGGGAAYTVSALTHQPVQALFSVDTLLNILLAILVYVGTNQLLLGLALSLARGRTFREAGIFRDALLIEVPLACIGYNLVEIVNRSPLAVVFILAPIALIYQAFMLPKTQAEAMKALESVNRDLASANQAIRQLNDDLFQTVAKVFDARDPYVGGHAAQVATYAVAVAKELGLPPERVNIVLQSAFLHDIGKIAIPEAILNKPARLTDLEYEFIKRHCDIGADLMSKSNALSHLAPFIRFHHERWDGKGYPVGLSGEIIPLEARILNLCDSVEAMASDRPYHRALTPQQIITEVRHCAGVQFDPQIAEAFVRVVERQGASFVVNSARSVTEQYSSSLLATGVAAQVFSRIYEPATEEPAPIK